MSLVCPLQAGMSFASRCVASVNLYGDCARQKYRRVLAVNKTCHSNNGYTVIQLGPFHVICVPQCLYGSVSNIASPEPGHLEHFPVKTDTQPRALQAFVPSQATTAEAQMHHAAEA